MEKWFNTSLTITKIRAKFNPSLQLSPVPLRSSFEGQAERKN